MDSTRKYMSQFTRKFGNLSDSEWLRELKSSVYNKKVDGVTFPGFPDPSLQSQFVGSSNENALEEGYAFYMHAKSYCKALGVPLHPQSRVLDFGVGWGRIIRFFLKDIEDYNLFGVDVDPNIIKVCKQTGVPGIYIKVNPSGPTIFDKESFDLIYAYSVFSHLAETIHLDWIKELTRILRPGGVLIATTEARSFIDFCTSLKNGEIKSGWHDALSTAFPDPSAALAAYDSGRFVYVPTGGGDFRDSSFYGEALIPKRYVEQNWTKNLYLRDFIDDRNKFWQAVIVMQKA
jgi:SAM-dependent methyltransferase